MKTFIKYDFYFQILFLIIGIISIFIMDDSYIQGILFYFFVGIPQLISYIIKLFFKIEKSSIFIIYGVLILPVWISVLLLIIFESHYEVFNMVGGILIAGFLYSPILALLYIFDNYKLFKYLK
jgi:hypothetical protein